MAKETKPLRDYQVIVVAVWVQNGQERTLEYPNPFFRKGVSPEQVESRFKYTMTHSRATDLPHHLMDDRKIVQKFMNGIRQDLAPREVNFRFVVKEFEPKPAFPKPLPPKPNPQLELLPKPKPQPDPQLELFPVPKKHHWGNWYGGYRKKAGFTS